MTGRLNWGGCPGNAMGSEITMPACNSPEGCYVLDSTIYDHILNVAATPDSKSDISKVDLNVVPRITSTLHIDGLYAPRPDIVKVIFNPPATVIFWSDDIKTVVKAQPGDEFDPEKGLAMAVAKRFFGNRGDYYNHIRKFLPMTSIEDTPDIIDHASNGKLAWVDVSKTLRGVMGHFQSPG